MVNITPTRSEVYVYVGSLRPVRFFLQYRARNWSRAHASQHNYARAV
jgi:hypothetical protein